MDTILDMFQMFGMEDLMEATKAGDVEKVEMLLESGMADVDAVDENGSTAFMWASQEGHKEIMHMLVEKKAKVNAQNKIKWSAFMYAASSGHVEIARHLLNECGADARVQDHIGGTPLRHAVIHRHVEIVKVLMTKHTLAELDDFLFRKNALLEASGMGNVEMIEYLVEQGADINEKNSEGTTPLMQCILRNQSKECVSVLLRLGADINVQDKDGFSPLVLAVIEGQTETVRLFLDAGASPTLSTTGGATPLILAAHFGFIDIARRLLSHNVPIDTQAKNGQNALIAASMHDHLDIVHFLVQHGASLHLRDKNNSTAFMIARQHNHVDIEQFLLSSLITSSSCLDLSKHNLTDTDVFEFSSLLASPHSSLSSLDLSFNLITYLPSTSLLSSLYLNPFLTFLSLRSNSLISSHLITSIEELTYRNLHNLSHISTSLQLRAFILIDILHIDRSTIPHYLISLLSSSLSSSPPAQFLLNYHLQKHR